MHAGAGSKKRTPIIAAAHNNLIIFHLLSGRYCAVPALVSQDKKRYACFCNTIMTLLNCNMKWCPGDKEGHRSLKETLAAVICRWAAYERNHLPIIVLMGLCRGNYTAEARKSDQHGKGT